MKLLLFAESVKQNIKEENREVGVQTTLARILVQLQGHLEMSVYLNTRSYE